MNLFSFLVIMRYSICLKLILFVTFLYLNSKVRFLIHIKEMLTLRATIGKEISIWLYVEELRIKKNNTIASKFSKWKVESITKYHKPKPPWYLFAKILLELIT